MRWIFSIIFRMSCYEFWICSVAYEIWCCCQRAWNIRNSKKRMRKERGRERVKEREAVVWCTPTPLLLLDSGICTRASGVGVSDGDSTQRGCYMLEFLTASMKYRDCLHYLAFLSILSCFHGFWSLTVILNERSGLKIWSSFTLGRDRNH